MANEIKVEIDDKGINKKLSDIFERTQNLIPAMGLIGLVIKRSIVENFKQEGRPTKWKPSLRAIKQHGQTLSDTGMLKSSFQISPESDSVSVFTPVKYAAIHNFGGQVRKRTGKSSKGKKVKIGNSTFTMPKRQFMMVQDEDWFEIKKKLSNYLLALK